MLLEFPLNLSQVPIVRELFGELEYETRSTDDESHDEDSEIDADTDSNGDERTVASASTNGVLQPELLARPARPPTKITGRKTTVTRSVFQVCRRIFPVEQHKRFEFCDHSVRIPPVKRYPEREEHGAEPTCIWQTKPDVGGYYTSVLIDSTIYNVRISHNLISESKFTCPRLVMLWWSNRVKTQTDPEHRTRKKHSRKVLIP